MDYKTSLNKMPFTPEQMKQVYDTNIIDFAQQIGLKIKNADRKTVHLENSGGLYIWKHGRGYYCYSTGEKGNIVDFVMKYYGIGKITAIEKILNTTAYSETDPNHNMKYMYDKPKKEFILPQKDVTQKNMIAYLMKRGIDQKIIQYCIDQKILYQAVHTDSSNGKTFKHCAFVGNDGNGEARYCFLRTTLDASKFRADVAGSDKQYGFSIAGKSDTLYIFESPIDLLSHATIAKKKGYDWQENHLLSCGGVTDYALTTYLESHKGIKEIKICFDSDDAGLTGARTISKRFGTDYNIKILSPKGYKDVNEYLKAIIKHEKAQEAERKAELPFRETHYDDCDELMQMD